LLNHGHWHALCLALPLARCATKMSQLAFGRFNHLLREAGFLMGFTKCWGRVFCFLSVAVALGFCRVSLADSPSQQVRPSTTPTPISSCAMADNAWVLVSSALVLMMTAPGLALFYCGLVRKKNVLSVMMQCIFMMCLMTVIWALYGYSFVFGGQQPWIGDFSHLLMRGVDAQWTPAGPYLPTVTDTTLFRMTHMIYQGMFFIITPALICGAFAERMKFSTMVVFMVLWGTVIYCPLAHWLWGAGGALNVTAEHPILGGAIDFAGGTVVHISSGVSALVCALMLGKRLGYGKEEMRPHNLTYTAIGAAMLWVGWFGFNAGSALSVGSLATCAFAATHLAAAAGGITWAAWEWFLRGKPSMLGVCSGLVAGLATITQAAGYVTLGPALLIGVIGATVCYSTCTVVKVYFGYDDSLDVFGVHGVAGTLGALLTGIFATRATGAFFGDANPALHDLKLGLLEGGSLWKGQLLAVGMAWLWAIAGTFILLKTLDILMGLRVSRHAEIEGLDVSQHGEEGYIFY
jgi:ammonium transporter, Amt family